MQIYHNKTLLIFLFHHQRIMWTLKQMQSINEDNPKLKRNTKKNTQHNSKKERKRLEHQQASIGKSFQEAILLFW